MCLKRIGGLLLALVPASEVLVAQHSTRACPATYTDARHSDASVRAMAEPRLRQAAAQHMGQTPPARLSATYMATSREAALALANWWAAQPKTGVEVREPLAPDSAELAISARIRAELPPGSTFTPAWSSCPQWTVRVEGAPGALSEADVAKWFELLRDAPSDGRWKLRGIGLTEPAPEPAP